MDDMSKFSAGSNAAKQNHHACCVQIDGIGILIEGVSGSGKTSLMLALLDTATNRGIEAAFVCDDQVFLEVVGGEIYAVAPENITGKIELYGFGIITAEYLARTKVSLVCKLVDASQIERMPELKKVCRGGIELPLLQLPQNQELRAVRIIMAQLNLPVWGSNTRADAQAREK